MGIFDSGTSRHTPATLARMKQEEELRRQEEEAQLQALMAQRQMEQQAMQQLGQQQSGEDQAAAGTLDKFGILDLVRNARQLPDRLAPGIDAMTGLNSQAASALSPTVIPQRQAPAEQAPAQMGRASMQPQTLMDMLQSETRGASSAAVAEKTDKAKRKAMAILRALQGAR